MSWWLALDDTTLENGCLQFLPGQHKRLAANPDVYKQVIEVHPHPSGPLR